jgi:hypothetical protein
MLATPGATMKDARRKQAEEQECDDLFHVFYARTRGTQCKCGLALFGKDGSATGRGWTDADSHPDTSASDEEAALKIAIEINDEHGHVPGHDGEVKQGALRGIAHARKSQAAEMARISKVLQDGLHIADMLLEHEEHRGAIAFTKHWIEEAESILTPPALKQKPAESGEE